jgi:hypothetical protein
MKSFPRSFHLVGLLALASASYSLPSFAQNLVRHPYLQMGTPSSVTVVWTTDTASEGVVHVGDDPNNLSQTFNSPSGTQHEVKVTGLTPGKRYYYSVGTNSKMLTVGDSDHYLTTSPTPAVPMKFRAWIVGDSGTGGTGQADVRDAMLNHVGLYQPQLFLHMGDMAYNSGTTSEFSANFFGAYTGILRHTMTWATLGNHEGSNSDSGTQTGPYYTAYVLPKAGEAGGVPSGTEAYYSFDYANTHFIVLDSHDSSRAVNGPMLTWMKSDLETTSQEWIVAFWHHPPYTKGSHNSDTESQLVEMRENALPILEAGGVDLVLGGHSHIYERSFLVDGAYNTPTTAAGHIKDPGDGKPDGQGPYVKAVGNQAHNGTVYIVAGHGGAGVSGNANHPLMYLSELAQGSCILDIQGNRLAIRNIRKDGVISDRFTMVKGTGLAIASPDGGETLSAGATVPITWATVGTIANVKLEFSANDGGTWQTIAASIPNQGNYNWQVPSVDTNTGLIRVSDASTPTVFDESNAGFKIAASQPEKVISFGDDWKYDDQGVDHGTAWLQSTFDDGAWKEGPGQLGYGDGDEATVLFNPSPNYPSVYFRKQIVLDKAVSAASLNVLHDDGVVVWINGTQVFSRYADNGVDYGSFASQTSADNELSSSDIDTTPFLVGANQIAVMVKQSDGSSSDTSFDLELTLTKINNPGGSGGSSGSGGSAGAGGSASAGSSGQSTMGTAGNISAGAGGSATAGSSTAAGGNTAGTGSDSNPATTPASDDGGCSCRMSSPINTASAAGLVGLLALGHLTRARSRRRRSKPQN